MLRESQTFDEKLSLLRPAWKQGSLSAFQDLDLRDRTIKNHFVKTHGFRTMEDYYNSLRR
ncbi:hypothetical protein LCGC14_0360350 [marine sediment metagenome]|uniref:Uncharacterized protein n=1 Tax=marine sediment metagenome TaxID=412755 RepID=A0A0F9VVK6_9ZZZZ|nr:hypothetical protein [bacterium]